MSLLSVIMHVAARRRCLRIGGVHLIADPDAVRDVLTDVSASFGRCAGGASIVDLADVACVRPLWDACNPIHGDIVREEIATLLRSVCLTSLCGPRDDAFDANEAALDAAGYIMMRTVMSPAIFDVGSMHRCVEETVSAALRHHALSLLPRWCRPDSGLDEAIVRMRSYVASMPCPASVPAGMPLDERARAIVALWSHGATALASSIAWLMCSWANDPGMRRLSVDGIVERTLLEHPPLWWIARRALRGRMVGCTPVVDGCAVTYPYVTVNEGDTVIMLPAAAQLTDGRTIAFSAGDTRCPAQHLTVQVLRELAMQLRDQRVDLAPAPGADLGVEACAVMRPRRPLLVPRHVQA